MPQAGPGFTSNRRHASCWRTAHAAAATATPARGCTACHRPGRRCSRCRRCDVQPRDRHELSRTTTCTRIQPPVLHCRPPEWVSVRQQYESVRLAMQDRLLELDAICHTQGSTTMRQRCRCGTPGLSCSTASSRSTSASPSSSSASGRSSTSTTLLEGRTPACQAAAASAPAAGPLPYRRRRSYRRAAPRMPVQRPLRQAASR